MTLTVVALHHHHAEIPRRHESRPSDAVFKNGAPLCYGCTLPLLSALEVVTKCLSANLGTNTVSKALSLLRISFSEAVTLLEAIALQLHPKTESVSLLIPAKYFPPCYWLKIGLLGGVKPIDAET